jgi:hypothetical protein
MHPRTSSLIFIGSIAVFIAALFPAPQLLDFTPAQVQVAFLSFSLVMGSFALYLRTFTED